MHTQNQKRYLGVVIGAVLLSGIPTASSTPQIPTPESTGLVEGCFLLPLEPGQLRSDQWCVKAPAGTPLTDLLAGAPEPFKGFETDSHITLGTDYDGASLSGSSFQWWAHGTCSDGVNYIGNFPSDWNDRASSAVLGPSSNGCNWFIHYENVDQGGDSFLCGRDSHDCTGIRMAHVVQQQGELCPLHVEPLSHARRGARASARAPRLLPFRMPTSWLARPHTRLRRRSEATPLHATHPWFPRLMHHLPRLRGPRAAGARTAWHPAVKATRLSRGPRIRLLGPCQNPSCTLRREDPERPRLPPEPSPARGDVSAITHFTARCPIVGAWTVRTSTSGPTRTG